MNHLFKVVVEEKKAYYFEAEDHQEAIDKYDNKYGKNWKNIIVTMVKEK